MPRVPALPSTALAPDIAAVYEKFTRYGPFADQAGVLAHVPSALDHLCQMLMELKAARNVPWRHIELAIVVTSKLNACNYCVASHSPVLAVEGMSPNAIAKLPDTDHPDPDEVDRLVIEYTTQVTQNSGRIRDNMFERLRTHFTNAQIVELTLRIALAGFYNRFNNAMQIDDGAAEAVISSLDVAPPEKEPHA